jgi:hypothetical protein
MRITYRVFLVGGIPITIAAAIALAAFMLLNEADRARSGAVLAGTIYRNLLSAGTARDNFLERTGGERTRFYELFLTYSEQARFDLQRLAAIARDPQHANAAAEAADALARYRDDMRRLVDVTTRNDGLVAEMTERADALVRLTDEARERQHQSNANIVQSLAEGDQKLRLARDIVDRAHELSTAMAALELARARATGSDQEEGAATPNPSFEVGRTRAAAARLSEALLAAGHEEAMQNLGRLLIAYEMSMVPVPDAALASTGKAGESPPAAALADWVERLLKVYAAEQRTRHDEVAGLLTYSVQAAETEQATQNIAIEALKLSNRAAAAIDGSDTEAIARIQEDSVGLSETMAAMPISPLIQSEMIDAFDQWRNGLATMRDRLEGQQDILEEMDATTRRIRPQYPDLRRSHRPVARLDHRPRGGALDHPAAQAPARPHDGAVGERARRADRRFRPP